MLLDFAGGITSLAQLIIDSSLQNNWSGITGNPMKFGLGNITLFFDLIFFYQHFVIYRDSPGKMDEEDAWHSEHQRLLDQRVD
jgi:cystinosin